MAKALNSEQNKAVRHIDGPVLILAGAGSGKTQTMTHRMAYMIENGVDPRNILAVTFTNKAAAEMRSRVEALTGSTRGMWIMTFHAMCLRMLRHSPELLGYRPGFTVCDESDKKTVIKRIIKDLDIDERVINITGVVRTISKCKEDEMDPEEYRASNAGLPYYNNIADIYSAYREELLKENIMDFDDLLLNGVRLLEENRDILSYYANRFRYIMVDEYQDTNHLQYKLIRMLASVHGNLCVVGDDDQCIYQWRGADISNILDFENDYPNAFTVRLEQNYRSDGNILKLANSVIRNNSERKSKSLWTDRPDGSKVTYKRLISDRDEAWWISSEIGKLTESEYNYRDIAILYRKNAQSRLFEERFMSAGIPYRVLAGLRFYDRKEIKDVMAYLKLVENPDDDVSLMRVINTPKRGFGAKTITALENYARVYGISMFKALCESELAASLSAKCRAAASDFAHMIKSIRDEQSNLMLIDIYEILLERSGYLKALEDERTLEADTRIENIMEFKTVITDFQKALDNGSAADAVREMRAESLDLAGALGNEAEAAVSEPTELAMFLEQIALLTDIDNHDEDENSVVLMTMHAAKGLEFPVVFMPGMEDEIFPGHSAYDDDSRLQEERRLCYVGITRAMKKLYLTGALSRRLYGKDEEATESLFISEMDTSCLDGDKTEKDRNKSRGGFTGEGGVFGSYMFGENRYGTADGYSGDPRPKPFGEGSRLRNVNTDPLAAARKAVHSRENIHNEFETGDTVRHPKFGEGMIIDQDEKVMIIIFDNYGQKKLVKGYVKMEKVDR